MSTDGMFGALTVLFLYIIGRILEVLRDSVLANPKPPRGE